MAQEDVSKIDIYADVGPIVSESVTRIDIFAIINTTSPPPPPPPYSLLMTGIFVAHKES